MGTLSGGSNPVLFIFASLGASLESKFFPVRVDPIFEMLSGPGKKSRSHKRYIHFVKNKQKKNMKVYPFTINIQTEGLQQILQTQIRLLLRSSLIWVSNVCLLANKSMKHMSQDSRAPDKKE